MDLENKASAEDELPPEKDRILSEVLQIKGRKTGKQTFVNHYQMELARVRAELRLSAYIIQTTKKPVTPYVPYVWNGLKPYSSTIDPEFVDALPNDVFVDGKSRLTALNMVDPEVDVKIDQTKISLPSINLTRQEQLAKRRLERKNLPAGAGADGLLNPKSKPIPWSEKKGSTRLTPFAKVQYRRPEIAKRKNIIHYSDVRQLRKQMDSLYSERARKKDSEDYERTTQDIRRMDIKVARERAHPMNRFLLDEACRSYFGPTRGSLRALKRLDAKPMTSAE